MTPGCYWFGNYSAQNPFAAFYLGLDGGGSFGPSPPGMPYCFGDGTGNTCPCGNQGAVGAGCANSLGAASGATLLAGGDAHLGTDTLSFSVFGVNGSKPGLMLRGDIQTGAGAGVGIGDGLLCTAGAAQRSQVQVTVAGATTFSHWNGAGFASVSNIGAATHFQYWYRDTGGSSCGSGFNFSNAWTITYQP